MPSKGRVLWGANNIFCVLTEAGDEIECRFKGKLLKTEEEHHNPLAPGDLVLFDEDCLIIERCARENSFRRWNKKHRSLQTIAANIQRACVVSSVGSPPFRPRFVDRAVIAAAYDEIPVTIIVNKAELLVRDEEYRRFEVWEEQGVEVLLISVLRETGLDLVADLVRGKTTAFLGQSGVGKSSLLNALMPDLNSRIGAVSEKYQRGRHTTTLARAYPQADGGAFLIDTPGVRELDLSFIHPQDLQFYFKEFAAFRELCPLSGCSHDHEPDCKVVEAFESDEIHPDRYESYLRILEEIRFARKGRYDR